MNTVTRLNTHRHLATITYDGIELDVRYKQVNPGKYSITKIGLGITGTLLTPKMARTLHPDIYEILSEILTEYLKTHEKTKLL